MSRPPDLSSQTTSAAPEVLRTLVDELLDQQQALPAVQRFSRWHHESPVTPGERYRALLPATAPGPGQQYAFEVDLDACTGCKACVAACHSLNGLEENESWRSAGLLVSANPRQSHRQTVTTACHHCVDPGCANGCPVLAYEKDPGTGIVRHLDDQCMGCNYCTMTCSYGVPSYSPARGIVRKCDMCRQRLDQGEAPACAQACPNGAIRIVLVDQEAVRTGSTGDATLLPGAAPSRITQPATRFISRNPLPAGMAPEADRSAELQPAHWPLVLMLAFTQTGTGLLAAGMLTQKPHLLAAAAALAAAGNAAAILHLGRPIKAWRAWMGWRKSWLSREIIAFGIQLPALLAAVGAMLAGMQLPGAVWPVLVWTALLAGVAGVACSGMVYNVTQRPSWYRGRSLLRFGLTTLAAAAAGAWISISSVGTTAGLVLISTLKFAAESYWQRSALEAPEGPLAGSARILDDALCVLWRSRMAALLCGGIVLPLLGLTLSTPSAVLVMGAAVLLMSGEILERLLFFRSAQPWHMPGWTTSAHS